MSPFETLNEYAKDLGLEELPEEVEVCCSQEPCMDNAFAQVERIAKEREVRSSSPTVLKPTV